MTAVFLNPVSKQNTLPFESLEFTTHEREEDTFKPTIGNESLHEDSNDNGVRVVSFATSKNLVGKSTMIPHRNIHKYTWTSPDGRLIIRLITY
jgi:hypothetical protein